MEDPDRDLIIKRLFTANCGRFVSYVSHEVSQRRNLAIHYTIDRIPDRTFTVNGVPKTGLNSAIWTVAIRAGRSAKDHAYLVTGQYRADMKKLLQGKLIDEHPRSDAQAGEVSPATPVDPKP